MWSYHEVLDYYVAHILPEIVRQYELDGVRDVPARSEAWVNFVDALCKEHELELDHPAWDWEAPGICDYV